ncbi:amino acid ABC transporter substrate-binding protein [Burkholderia cenocepacia]|jgi:general L-amino acid transport system substrate-binding protein|uniref:amino acid ABC transporter substrate-binding protein n=1 Tax=Burkholderia cenocepacia TaxID=95486 RepID=UPI001F308748|nr:amino acid ABC transporter substrate-binding protein [Burkholderia cenocepacia]MCG0576802.1 amino acid ABC transporter substrate-binding protein [Burkholderia cenocepacia]MCW3527492.1 amino acid ABC transporter substrate-binding protein [Burkholderia cenocepacia]MCW3617536.1 amino acid ABC transporter substrate-binding protein [Burkholderia cenocepacia]MCW3655431.1 amino acid ABC transporter substrate-binding protein [Burkholderia cenocepacia]MCW3670130.1 amino acid ABC transporter substrat
MKGLKWIVGVVIFAASATAFAGTTFDSVKKKGFVTCGVSTNLPGFAFLDSKGAWQGLDVDMCRAIAAAVLGDASKTKITPLTTQQRFTALQAGEVDVLTRNTTQTLSRDSTLGLVGTGVNFYDAQGLMVKKSLGVKEAKALDGSAICVLPGTTTELNLTDWFRSHNLKFRPVVLSKYEELVRAFAAGRCDAVTADKSELATVRVTLQDPDQYIILPDSLSKEPLGPMVRQGDEAWFTVVRWTLNAMFEAEEFGVTSKNVDQMRKSPNPNIQRLLGVTPGLGKGLGISDAWAYNIVKQVGNYGETYDRAMGMGSPAKMPRGLNALYTQGGLMYGWPIR